MAKSGGSLLGQLDSVLKLLETAQTSRRIVPSRLLSQRKYSSHRFCLPRSTVTLPSLRTLNCSSFRNHSTLCNQHADFADLDVESISASSSTPIASNATSSSVTTQSGPSFEPKSGTHGSKIMNKLSELGISVESCSHEAVLTSAAHLSALATAGFEGKGVTVKNLLLKSKRQKTVYCIVFAADKPNIDLKALGTTFGVGSGFRQADSSFVFEMEKGNVTPLAVLFDSHNVVKVILDETLKSQGSSLNVHPGTNEATVSITFDSLCKYIESCGNECEFMDLTDYFILKPGVPSEALRKQKEAKKAAAGASGSGGGGGGKKKKKGGSSAGSGSAKKEVSGAEQEGILFKKSTNFGDWYQELMVKCELIDYTDISGCYVLRKKSYYMWERVQKYMDDRIKEIGVQNAYFPLFVSEDALKREAKHFEDFSPEVAWVTHSGDTPLDKKLAVRPTSETIMYPMFRRWIRSYRDLPLLLNQWCNVVRWEFKNPTPFLRTREFLWQEGHTAHATADEAQAFAEQILDIYADTYQHVLAIPTIKGKKTPAETFPGADHSLTVEAYIPGSSRGIQGATSHYLGTNFSKMFHVDYLDDKGQKQLAHQTSWGYTTRSVGVMIMTHSDDHGLCVPPRVAEFQVVIVPIQKGGKKKSAEQGSGFGDLLKKAQELKDVLHSAGIRVFIDDRETKNPGWKFIEWEMKGVPLRMELGPKDMDAGVVTVGRRDMRDERDRMVKVTVPWKEIVEQTQSIMDDMHRNLYAKAEQSLKENVKKVTEWKDFLEVIQNGQLALAPHCQSESCEEKMGQLTKEHFERLAESDPSFEMTGKSKALCIPKDQPDLPEGTVCVCSRECAAKTWILFGRSY